MASSRPRLSHQGLRVLRKFLDEPRGKFSGSEIADELRIGSGTLYPLLGRFEDLGWLGSEWEAIDPSEAKRPRKRFYYITAVGQNEAGALFRELGPQGGLAWT